MKSPTVALVSLLIVAGAQAAPLENEYRGYRIDLSEIAGHKAFNEIESALRHQLDIVENVGLSPRVLKFFRTIPIEVDQFACMGDNQIAGGKRPSRNAACYEETSGPRSSGDSVFAVWDSQKSQWTASAQERLTRTTAPLSGIVSVRVDLSRSSRRPVMLHEMLHAYHAKVLPAGFKNPSILVYYKEAKDRALYPADAYLMTNEREFFAVTASVFLYGEDGPRQRSELQKQQPEYYQHLVWMFGFDPDRNLNVAMADKP